MTLWCCIGGVRSHVCLSREHAPAGKIINGHITFWNITVYISTGFFVPSALPETLNRYSHFRAVLCTSLRGSYRFASGCPHIQPCKHACLSGRTESLYSRSQIFMHEKAGAFCAGFCFFRNFFMPAAYRRLTPALSEKAVFLRTCGFIQRTALYRFLDLCDHGKGFFFRCQICADVILYLRLRS